MAGGGVEAAPLAEVTDPWGTLMASSNASRNRPQGQCMFLTLAEHTLGRMVDDPMFMFDSQSISARHCRIFLKSITMEDGQSGMGVFIKDSSSNGTFVNNQRLRKETPDFRLRDGDVISLAALPEFETGFAYVFRDTSAGLKRKPEELRKSEDGKRIRSSTVDFLADLRRLERSNQELRQKLELECNKRDGLNADLRAAKTSTESMVKEAVEQSRSVYNRMLAELQADLSAKTSALEESSANLVQQESIIEDLHNRLKAAAQSRIEAEEALNNFKADREAIEKKLEDERSQWNQERQEIGSRHEAAVEKIRAEANEESIRQSQYFSRQQKQLEDQLTAVQESIADCREQIEHQRKQLEQERETRMNFEKKAQELQSQIDVERKAVIVLKQELEKTIQDLQICRFSLEACKHERDAANTKIVSLQLEKEELSNKLKLQRQRFEGARDRILLRETQLSAFQSTAEDIARLQQKQQKQLQSLMQTLRLDDADAAAGHFDDGQNHDDEMPDAEATARRLSIETQIAATQERTLAIDLNEMAGGFRWDNNASIAQTEAREDTLPTQQLQLDATQIEPPDRDRGKDDLAVMETQILPEEQRLETADGARDRNGRDHREQMPRRIRLGARSFCTADLMTSEVLGSDESEDHGGDGGESNSQEEEQQRVVASQVGNSDSLQLNPVVSPEHLPGTRADYLGSQCSAIVVKAARLSPIDEQVEEAETDRVEAD